MSFPATGGADTEAPRIADDAAAAFLRLDGYLEDARFRGYEFDDFLGSPLVRACTLGNLFLQRVAVQAGELTPFHVRPLLGVRKLESTKARGFFAKGYLYRYLATRDERWLTRAFESLDWLLEHRSEGYPGMAWGNAFDFASRGGFFPKGRPTIVWTAHIAESFDLAHSISGRPEYLEAVEGSATFVMEALERHEDPRGVCFAYAPGIQAPIYNSNLLGATALIRWWRHSDDAACLELARKSVAWTLAQQNPDGSWWYGEGARYRWIDNLHTAYDIDCLTTLAELGGEELVPEDVITRSYEFWIENFFLADGTPRYYHDRTHPIDIQCAAQAIETASKLAPRFEGAGALAGSVLGWTLRHMRKPNGAFRYQIRRFWRNDLESIHWGQATMLAALGAYLRFLGGGAAE